MYEQSDFSPMDKSMFQKYDSNVLFSDAFRTNYAYNSPSALYANSPLGLGSNFTAHSQYSAPQSSFAAALNQLNMQGNVAQNTFGLSHPNQLNENTPGRSEHTSLEEKQYYQEEQNRFQFENQVDHKSQHNMLSTTTIPNNPNNYRSNNIINSNINSNNTMTGSNNININGSNSMNFTSQQNFILKKHLNESNLPLPSLPQVTPNGQFLANNQKFRFPMQTLEDNLIQVQQNYPGTPYYDSLIGNNDNQTNLNFQYKIDSPSYKYQATQQPNQANQSQQQNYSFSAATSGLKKNPLPPNFFYDSPCNQLSSFLPYSPQINQQSAQNGFSQFISNQQFQAELSASKQQLFGEQEDGSQFPFVSTPVHQLEQNQQVQNPLQQQQQQPLIPQPTATLAQQAQAQKSGLNLLQQKQQQQQLLRYNQEKAQLQQQQLQYTEKALLEQQQQTQQIPFQQNFQFSQQQQSQFANLMMQGQKLPLQHNALTLSMKNLANNQEVPTNKITVRPNKGGKDADEQNYQETQESIANIEEDENGEESIEEENGEDNEEDDDAEDEDEFKGQKGKKVKKAIAKSSKKKKGLTSISQVSSSSLQNQTNPGSTTKLTRKQINETKNIPKNYSKAIIGYIQKHPDDCARLLGPDYTFDEFDKFLMERKEKLTAIKDLRSLWTTNVEDKLQLTFNRVFRILSFKFFRENAVSYIYSSRKIKNTRALISYRFILQRALHEPESFSFMKFQS